MSLRSAIALVGLTAALWRPLPGAASEPIADAHTHYNWNQSENTPPAAVIDIWRRNDVKLAVVAGMPPELALQIREAGGPWVIPIWSPYLTPEYRHTWHLDKTLPGRAREALESGRYRGIGEVHLIPGLGPRRDNPVLERLIRLAGEFDVPFMIHTDASNYRYLLPVCRDHPGTTFVWAHAGGILPPEQVSALLDACPNVFADLSARDPKRYVRTPITDARGHLLPEWRAVVMDHPDRFMVGSDPVWPVDRMHGWETDDSGWSLADSFLEFHRTWISNLPDEVRQRILIENARRVWDP